MALVYVYSTAANCVIQVHDVRPRIPGLAVVQRASLGGRSALAPRCGVILERSGMTLGDPSTWTETALAQAQRDLRIMQARARRTLLDNRVSLEVTQASQPANLTDLTKLWGLALEGTLP